MDWMKSIGSPDYTNKSGIRAIELTGSVRMWLGGCYKPNPGTNLSILLTSLLYDGSVEYANAYTNPAVSEGYTILDFDALNTFFYYAYS